MPVAVGFALQPDEEFLERCHPLLALCDYGQVCPETLWRVDAGGASASKTTLVDNGFHGHIAGLIEGASLFAVAHGVGLSLGAIDDDDDRVSLWSRRLQRDHERFAFAWMSDHAGLTTSAGLHLALPVPVPPSRARAAATMTKLRLLRDICGEGLVETSALPFCAGAPHADADVVAAAVDEDGLGILLDLHNVHTMAVNLGFDVDDWLSRLPLDRVREIHVSGGSLSDPGWLPDGRQVRLDSHDDAVPDEVFDLLARVAPRCPRLRGVTLERMEGTVHNDDDVAGLARELQTVRTILALPEQKTQTITVPATLGDVDVDDARWVRALLADDPALTLHELGFDVDAAGARTAGLLIAKLRFERLMNGDNDVVAAFDSDPAAFVARFRAYHRATPPTAWNPVDEARLFRVFQRGLQG